MGREGPNLRNDDLSLKGRIQIQEIVSPRSQGDSVNAQVICGTRVTQRAGNKESSALGSCNLMAQLRPNIMKEHGGVGGIRITGQRCSSWVNCSICFGTTAEADQKPICHTDLNLSCSTLSLSGRNRTPRSGDRSTSLAHQS